MKISCKHIHMHYSLRTRDNIQDKQDFQIPNPVRFMGINISAIRSSVRLCDGCRQVVGTYKLRELQRVRYISDNRNMTRYCLICHIKMYLKWTEAVRGMTNHLRTLIQNDMIFAGHGHMRH